MDHVLVRRPALKTVRDVEVFPEEEVASPPQETRVSPIRLVLDFEAPGRRPRGVSRQGWKSAIKREFLEAVPRETTPLVG